MLLDDSLPQPSNVSLCAARDWVNGLYASLHQGLPLVSAVDTLGDLLDGSIDFIRIHTEESGAVSEWQRPDAACAADLVCWHGQSAVPTFQCDRGGASLVLLRAPEAQPSLLITYTGAQYELLLLLRLSSLRTSSPGHCEDYYENYCEDYGERYGEVLLLTLPQLYQVHSLLNKLKRPLRAASVVQSLLPLVPLPLLALNAHNEVEYCNESASAMLLRLAASEQGGDTAHSLLPTTVMVRDLKVDGMRQRLRYGALELPVSDLFEEQWEIGPVRIVSVEDCRLHPNLNQAILAAIYHLSSAEVAVCEWVLAGKEPSDIAQVQNRSINTIKSQLRAIYKKVGVQNTAQLARRLFFNPAYWVGR